MKPIALSLLVAAFVVGVPAPAAKAETRLSSFNVVSLAYQGRLAESGIPGYSQLAAGTSFGSITAENVIEAAIASGYIPETTRQNTQFIAAVKRHLDSLVNQN